jgi:hypothetical protein
MTIIITYAAYLAISIAMTIWVARTLFKSGRVFLVDVFRGNESLADSVNHLLVVGFYLINLGFILLSLKLDGEVLTSRVAIESAAEKIGLVLLVLGGMHFFNLMALSATRSKQHKEQLHADWTQRSKGA